MRWTAAPAEPSRPRWSASQASDLASVGKAARDVDSARVEVHLPDAGADERQQQSRVELEHVVGRAGDDRGDSPERPPALLLDREADELELVLLVLAGGRQLVARNRELGSARRLAVEPDHRPAA